MEQVAELSSGKCVRRYSTEHPLFAAGNALRALKYRRQDGESLYDDDEDDDDGEQDDVFQCRLLTCNVGFRSVAAYEEHYDLEMHDAFFKVLSKKKPMYTCLVDGCEEKFTHDDKRNRHLVQVHQYPVGFSLHRPRRVQSKMPSSKQAEKKKRPRKKKDRGDKNSVHNQMEVDQAAEPMGEAQDTVSVRASPKALAESGRASEDPGDPKDTDILEDLEESMRNLRIPKTLSFGRKQRGRR